MAETVWSPGDKLKFLDKDGKWTFGTVTSVDEGNGYIFATLDRYPRSVKGMFRSQSPRVVKVETEPKRRKQNAHKK